jgi:hypothetical protein
MTRSKKLKFCDALLQSTCILALGLLSTVALAGCLVAGGGFPAAAGVFLAWRTSRTLHDLANLLSPASKALNWSPAPSSSNDSSSVFFRPQLGLSGGDSGAVELEQARLPFVCQFRGLTRAAFGTGRPWASSNSFARLG